MHSGPSGPTSSPTFRIPELSRAGRSREIFLKLLLAWGLVDLPLSVVSDKTSVFPGNVVSIFIFSFLFSC